MSCETIGGGQASGLGVLDGMREARQLTGGRGPWAQQVCAEARAARIRSRYDVGFKAFCAWVCWREGWA